MFFMKNYDINAAIDKLEKQIQYLHSDYKALINRYNTVNDLRELRLQIKHAEESLRLKKRMAVYL